MSIVMDKEKYERWLDQPETQYMLDGIEKRVLVLCKSFCEQDYSGRLAELLVEDQREAKILTELHGELSDFEANEAKLRELELSEDDGEIDEPARGESDGQTAVA